MNAASMRDLKIELGTKTQKELIELVLRMARFKKDNKELLTYQLFESADEEAYIRSVKSQIDELFESINTSGIYYMMKGLRKTLRFLDKRLRYSGNKETEVELRIYFCEKIKSTVSSISRWKVLRNLYDRQIIKIQKAMSTLHEDLQFDYNEELNRLI